MSKIKSAKATPNKLDASAKRPIRSIKAPKPGKRKKQGKKKKAVVLFEGKIATPIPPDNFPDKTQDSRGRPTPLATIPNLEFLLRYYGIEVWYDVIGKKIVMNVPNLKGCPDNADAAAWATIISLIKLNKMPSSHASEFIVAVANSHLYNPVADWILSKPWDGESRLELFFNTLSVKGDYPLPLRNILLRRWLISAVAAAIKPSGFGSRGVLVLQGPQSIGKTRWIMNLVPNQVLQEQFVKIDHHLDASDKDSKLTALRHWIVEIGELDSSFKKDVARLKGFITGTKDKIRVPYGKADSEYSRRTVFCATVNRDEFLVDDTGNTRWWTIAVISIDYDHAIDMQQVFAEAHTLFLEGEQWWLTKKEEELLESRNADHQATTAIADRIMANMDFTKKASWKNAPLLNGTEILQVLGIQHPINAQVKECGAVMKQHIGDRKKSNGRSGWRVEFIKQPDITSF